MQLLPWTHIASANFALRGWHSPPSGKPLLHFLHGNGFCGRVYEPLLQALSVDFDLWLSDIQGHGDSDHGGRFLGWNRSAELAVEAFEAGRERFGEVPRLALGHSFGGVLSGLIMAHRPQLFDRAVLLDPVFMTPAMIAVMALSERLGLKRQHVLAKLSLKRRRQWPDRRTAFELLSGRGTFKGWAPEALQAYVDHALKDMPDGGVELKCQPSREADIFNSFPHGLWAALRRLRTPTRIIHGNRTYPFVGKSVARLCALNAAVSARQVDGGHCFMQERPQGSAGWVREFLLPG
jgi:pimeloyl-ACP methyl ester carboxylesterase